MNDIDFIKIFNLGSDPSLKVYEVHTFDRVKYIEVGRDPIPTFCEICGCRMHSKGITKRHPSHPIMNDSYKLFLIVRERRWTCPRCGHVLTEEFPFLERYSHSTNVTPMLILEAMKDLDRSSASVGRQFGVSDTHVHDVFTAFVDLKRLTLPEYLSIDEVYMNISPNMKYALVLMDFQTGEIVDILKNRWASTMEEYFLGIPRNERAGVKYVIADGYAAYAEITARLFPNAVLVLDSFHAVSRLIQLINSYINDVLKKYKEIDRQNLEKENAKNNTNHKEVGESKEVYLLRRHRWVMLKNMDEMEYDMKQYYNKHIGMVVDSYRIENEFLKLDDDFEKIRDLKEEFIRFNNKPYHDNVAYELSGIIKMYKKSGIHLFIEFAEFLENHMEAMMNSFTIMKVERKSKRQEDLRSRLSNGPMESFNRKPKDYKRNSRGFSNFDYTRNRILWATRKNPEILAVPKPRQQIHSYRGKKRGKYNTKKKK